MKNLNSKPQANISSLRTVLFMLILAFGTLIQAPVLGAEKPEVGYDLDQKSLIVGNVTVRIYPKAVQVTDHGKGIVYVSRAPDWKLQIINAKEKMYFEGKIADFTSSLTQGVTLFTGRMLTDATYSPPTKQPDNLLLYTTNAEFLKRATENKKNLTNSNGNPKTIDVWTDPKIPAPPQAVALLGRLFGYRSTPGVPVRVRYFDFDHEEKVYLKTLRVTKRELTDADFDKRLTSYKQVTPSSAVLRTKQQDEDVSDLLGGFGDGLPAKNKH